MFVAPQIVGVVAKSKKYWAGKELWVLTPWNLQAKTFWIRQAHWTKDENLFFRNLETP